LSSVTTVCAAGTIWFYSWSWGKDRIFESIFIEVAISENKSIIIGSCYRPNIHPFLTGSEQFNYFIEIFSNLCSSLPSNSYLFGDFNINLLSHSTNRQVSEYIDTLFSYGFLQNVTYPTRVSNVSATLIDHVICNSNLPIRDSFILVHDISDHYPIIFSLNYQQNKSKPKIKLKRNFSDEQMLAFGNALKNIGLNSVLDSNDPNTAYNDFEGTFVDLFNLFFPPTPIKTSRRNCPIEDWMTKGLLISRNEKLRLFSISKSFPTLPNISLYKTYRNIFNSTVRTAKKLHYEKLFHKSKFNLKETWSGIFKTEKNWLHTILLRIPIPDSWLMIFCIFKSVPNRIHFWLMLFSIFKTAKDRSKSRSKRERGLYHVSNPVFSVFIVLI